MLKPFFWKKYKSLIANNKKYKKNKDNGNSHLTLPRFLFCTLKLHDCDTFYPEPHISNKVTFVTPVLMSSIVLQQNEACFPSFTKVTFCIHL